MTTGNHTWTFNDNTLTYSYWWERNTNRLGSEGYVHKDYKSVSAALNDNPYQHKDIMDAIKGNVTAHHWDVIEVKYWEWLEGHNKRILQQQQSIPKPKQYSYEEAAALVASIRKK